VARAARLLANFVAVCYLVAVLALFADLHVKAYGSASAGPGGAAYAALRAEPPGRLLELPVLHPNVDRGSVYFYYDMKARRERPSGYSTIAPKPAALLALRLEPLNCGDWRPGLDGVLNALDVRYIAFHSGLFYGSHGWFAWRELRARGWGEVARDGGITILARGRPPGSSPVPEPTERLVFCAEWVGRSPRYRHAAFWARGRRLQVVLTSGAPDRITFTVDGRRVRSVRVVVGDRVGVPLGHPGWHLVGVDVRRTDRGLRLAEVRVS
jgi:hypothetical protein